MKTATRRRALTVEMTSGSLWKNILLFSLPLMMTQVLEVLFNLSDVAIAGKYAYNTYVALGSVGSTTTLVTLFTGLLIGLGGGVNVAVARGLGMGNDEDVEHTTHSSFLICLAMGVLTCLVCVFFAEPMLRLLHTKEEFLPGAVLYLKLYALGLPAMGIYNCGNGILSATGDTKRPPAVSDGGGRAECDTEPGVRYRLRHGGRGRGYRQRHRTVGVCAAHYHPPAAPQGRLPPGYPQAAAAPPGLQACAADRHPLRIAERYIRRG